ncbi:hypothetical protein CC2G_006808 [Coprinopsis cinerea AmutBmut pab1-1]|nr:hypothetical protein CC2G_006808 [Coprinopsis cinerea AmutBmut pab1-1]
MPNKRKAPSRPDVHPTFNPTIMVVGGLNSSMDRLVEPSTQMDLRNLPTEAATSIQSLPAEVLIVILRSVLPDLIDRDG